MFLAAFVRKDSKSAKIQPCHQCLFALLGYAHVKGVLKTLVQLIPVDDVQILKDQNQMLNIVEST